MTEPPTEPFWLGELPEPTTQHQPQHRKVRSHRKAATWTGVAGVCAVAAGALAYAHLSSSSGSTLADVAAGAQPAPAAIPATVTIPQASATAPSHPLPVKRHTAPAATHPAAAASVHTYVPVHPAAAAHPATTHPAAAVTHSATVHPATTHSAAAVHTSASVHAPVPAPVRTHVTARPVPVPMHTAVRPAPSPSPTHTAVLASSSSLGARVLAEAETRKGDPYHYGSAGPSEFDCSGLVYWAARQVGITNMPRDTYEMLSQGVSSGLLVRTSNPQPGDLAFFGSGHVEFVTSIPDTTFGAQHSGVPVGFNRYYPPSYEPTEYFRIT